MVHQMLAQLYACPRGEDDKATTEYLAVPLPTPICLAFISGSATSTGNHGLCRTMRCGS